jgi:formiminoglutamase
MNVVPAYRIHRGDVPLILSLPHSSTVIPPEIEGLLVSPWLARKDTDWWIDRLYGMADELGVTCIEAAVSRTVIDVNRDPSGHALYPGKASTALCPVTTFDGERLYRFGCEPDESAIDERRSRYFEPYHACLTEEIERLRSRFGCVVLYDAHSIRSKVPRLFDGNLPSFNIGTNDGGTCAADLSRSIERACAHEAFTQVTNDRFKGGWIIRRHGQPSRKVHALQMELACRSYLKEPVAALTPDNWPPQFNPSEAAAVQAVLKKVLQACLDFAAKSLGVSK